MDRGLRGGHRPLSRVVVVSYPYPPMPSTGANRWAAIAKYLRRAGHDVTVLTTSAFGSLPDDGEGVVRTTDLIASGALRRLTRRPELPEPGGPIGPDKPPPALFTRVLVPDIYAVTWVPGAVRTLRRLIRERQVDCVISTSPYESGHLVPLALGRSRPPWIADFRDSWIFEPWRERFPTAPQRALDRRLERLVVTRADRVISVHQTLTDDFRDRLGVEVAYVPNGWDPELEEATTAAEVPPLDSKRISIVHTGKLWGMWGRNPSALFEALRRLSRDDPGTAERFELVLAGRLDSEEERLLADSALEGLLRHVGPIPRAAATALQRRAGALLLLTSRQLSWETPGKLFEYLAAGRPILALADGNEAARVVRDTGTGMTVAPDNVDAIATALRGVVEGELERAYSPRGLARYLYPAPARAVEEEILAAVAQAGRRATA
jgi:glycosyltransferase involved in cell wall biosynthesis